MLPRSVVSNCVHDSSSSVHRINTKKRLACGRTVRLTGSSSGGIIADLTFGLTRVGRRNRLLQVAPRRDSGITTCLCRGFRGSSSLVHILFLTLPSGLRFGFIGEVRGGSPTCFYYQSVRMVRSSTTLRQLLAHFGSPRK